MHHSHSYPIGAAVLMEKTHANRIAPREIVWRWKRTAKRYPLAGVALEKAEMVQAQWVAVHGSGASRF